MTAKPLIDKGFDVVSYFIRIFHDKKIRITIILSTDCSASFLVRMKQRKFYDRADSIWVAVEKGEKRKTPPARCRVWTSASVGLQNSRLQW